MKSINLLRRLSYALLPVGVFTAAAWLLPTALAPRFVPAVEARLRASEVCGPTARLLAHYCQSDRSLFPGVLDYAWLPEDLNQVRHGAVELRVDGARVEFGGGAHRYGYELRRDGELSVPGENSWRLEYYATGEEPELLLTLTTRTTEVVDVGTLVTNVTAAYTRQLQAFPSDENAHRGRIRTLVQFGRPARARQACREMLQHMPDEAWPVLVNSLIDTAERGSSLAVRRMEEYVARRPDFLRHLDLAYFHELQQQPVRATEAVRRALAFDANVPAGRGGDTEFRGHHAAMYLYRKGQFEVASALCDKLQRVWINGEYAKPSLRNLQAAADRASHGEVMPVDWPPGIPPFYPFEDIDLSKLLGRPMIRPGRNGS